MEHLDHEIFDNATLQYLKLLSKQYTTIASASTRIINLQAIMNLPKGTEHFLSDIHGEYEAFNHVLKNASGVIKGKIDQIFGTTMRDSEKRTLATLVYYPEQKLELISKEEDNLDDWYRITLYRLVRLCKELSYKYTRSKIRKALPEEFEYIIEELIHELGEGINRQEYYSIIIDTIIRLDRAKPFIITLSQLIQRLAIDRLHIIGDIFDRGPGADIIMNTLMDYHSVDIQWGNHDILWMGAASGCPASICNVLRLSSRHFTLHTIEESYGINLIPLATFAMDKYGDDSCDRFQPSIPDNYEYIDKEKRLAALMHKAVSILQFKCEGNLIKRHKSFQMEDRLVLEKIDYARGTIVLDEKEYPLNDRNFPTIDPANPYLLTREEEEVMEKLRTSFMNSEKLQRHVRFLFTNGSMYLTCNSNLLYHGCIPLNEDGTLRKITFKGKEYSGRKYIDKLERTIREAYYGDSQGEERQFGIDLMWYLWCGPDSPLYGKKTMATFERYFIDDKEPHKEVKDPYYKLRNEEEVCLNILEEFGLDPSKSHIINGHVPVMVGKGESPVKANGRLLVIDGGLSKAYQKQTGIAGYTLIYNSFGLTLASHEPFESTTKAIKEEIDILSSKIELEHSFIRRTVADTDGGVEIKKEIEDLKLLLKAYRKGIIKEG